MSGTTFMTRNHVRKLLVATYVLLITFVVLEVAVRIWGYSERHIYNGGFKFHVQRVNHDACAHRLPGASQR